MPTTTYDLGDTVRLQATFTNAAGALADPATVSFIVRDPTGTETTYTYAAATVSKASVGVFFRLHVPDAGGHWRWRAVSTGDPATVEEDAFYVKEPWEG